MNQNAVFDTDGVLTDIDWDSMPGLASLLDIDDMPPKPYTAELSGTYTPPPVVEKPPAFRVSGNSKERKEKNRHSAKSSRERKKAYIKMLETTVKDLSRQVESLRSRNTKLVEENNRLKKS